MENQEKPDVQSRRPETEQSEEYAFLQETIKDNRKAKRRIFLKFAGLGLVFGMTASLGFFALKPMMEDVFGAGTEQVTIPKEEPEEPEEPEAEETLSVDGYREMNEALTEIGEEASRSIAEVIGIGTDGDWQQREANAKSVSGVIVADNGREYLIFAPAKQHKDAERFRIKFVDGKVYDAQIKKTDGTTGYGIYSVQKSDLKDGTRKRIRIAGLGTTGSVRKGNTIIAIGSPFGYSGAMGFGVAASSEKYVQHDDGEYRLICTDITGAENGSGALVNIQGEIVGIIDPDTLLKEEADLVVAYGISDMKRIIERLSNGEDVPYVGIRGVTVTEELAKEQGIPAGIYVQSVSPDSPAMEAGIQSGDVITGIGNEEITSMKRYHVVLMEKEPGNVLKMNGKRMGTDGYADLEYKVKVGALPLDKK